MDDVTTDETGTEEAPELAYPALTPSQRRAIELEVLEDVGVMISGYGVTCEQGSTLAIGYDIGATCVSAAREGLERLPEDRSLRVLAEGARALLADGTQP